MNLQQFPEISLARAAFASGKSLQIEFRKQQLLNFMKMFDEEENRQKINEALYHDLRKSSMEATLTEMTPLKTEIQATIQALKSWTRPKYLPKRLFTGPDTACIRRDPHGVVLILGTWNYPFYISLMPLIGAIAAGNCAIIKPSEIAEHSAYLIAQLVQKYLDNDCYHVILGDVERTRWLLTNRFDYIFFTGSINVGRSVLQMAALHLTPVTLELGGKSPVYLDQSACCKSAVKRILWGKLLNLGQTCVAPDYIICNKEVEKEFLKYAKEILSNWYGDTDDLQKSKELPRIVNLNHFRRLNNLLHHTRGNILLGGLTDEKDLWIEPTLIGDVDASDPLMKGEIFGPILPFVTIDSVDNVIKFIRTFERPLALYIFSKNSSVTKKLLDSTLSGGVCVNDVMLQIADLRLPFGGTGQSGMGQYHGKHSFETFSHPRGVVYRGLSYPSEKWVDIRYPPLTPRKMAFYESASLVIGYVECKLRTVLKYSLAIALGYGLCILLQKYYFGI